MVDHGVEGGVTLVWMSHLDDFHLVELVESVQAADFFSVAAGLPTKAGGVPADFLGQIRRLQHHVAVDVGQGDLRGGDHVQVVLLHVVHLAFLVRELSCAVAGVGVDHVGWDEFRVAGVVGFLQEKADEAPLQFGALALVEGEPGAGDLGPEVEVDEVVFLGEVPMGLGGPSGGLGLRAAEHFHVVVGSFAFSHEVAGGVGERHEERLELLFRGVHGVLQLTGLGFQPSRLGFDLLRLGLLSFTHQAANLPGQRIALGEDLVELGLGRTSLGVQIEDLIHRGGGVNVSLGQGVQHSVSLFAKALKGQHGAGSVRSKNKNSRPVGAGSSQALRSCQSGVSCGNHRDK